MTAKKMMPIDAMGKAIGVPVEDWPGRCYEIATALVEAKLIRGKPEYGFYYGPVCGTSMFAGKPLVRHGWIRRPDKKICDPTRWVFEDEEPYIYVGDDQDNYDMGMNRFAENRLGPPPTDDADPRSHTISLKTRKAVDFVSALFHGKTDFKGNMILNGSQVHYLANLPYHRFGGLAPQIYRALINAKLQAWIPIDNRRAAGV